MEIALYVLLGIVGVIAVLLIIAAIRAACLKKDPPAMGPSVLDEETLNEEKYAKTLSEMIQIETISKRGQTDLTKYFKLHEKLEELFPLVHKTCDKQVLGGAALLFTWRGKNSNLRPIILTGHMDTVEVAGEWKHGPFSGDIVDGNIWGRGALDDKGTVCYLLNAVEELIEEGFTPESDVYIAFGCDEECAGGSAIKIVEYLKEKNVTASIVIDEGTTILQNPYKGVEAKCAIVCMLEKGLGEFKFTARSQGGHSSKPPRNNPLARLAKLIDEVETKYPFEAKVTKPVQATLDCILPYMSFKYRFIVGNPWLFKPIIPNTLAKLDRDFEAMLRTTCIFTKAEGSAESNVIPQAAWVAANLRFMVHDQSQQCFERLSAIARKYDIEAEIVHRQRSKGRLRCRISRL